MQYHMKRKIKIAIVAILFPILLWTMQHTYSNIEPPTLVYIPKGNPSTLLDELSKQNIPLNFFDYRFFKRYGVPSSGWVRFAKDEELTREEFIEALVTRKREKTRRVVMYSGDTIERFCVMVGEQTGIPAETLLAEYKRHSEYSDAGIMAGFYRIPYDTTASSIIYHMVAKSEKEFISLADKYMDEYSKKEWKTILVKASIIQKETQDEKEMPLIASVIENRLKKGLKLQMDAALNYGKHSHQIVTADRIKDDKSRNNTYANEGLPLEPLCSCTLSAIEAALKPAKTKYLYFMLNQRGRHNFAKTYKEHQRNVKRFKDKLEKKKRAESLAKSKKTDTNSAQELQQYP